MSSKILASTNIISSVETAVTGIQAGLYLLNKSNYSSYSIKNGISRIDKAAEGLSQSTNQLHKLKSNLQDVRTAILSFHAENS